jgi:predicted RNA-binding protein with PIN domain
MYLLIDAYNLLKFKYHKDLIEDHERMAFIKQIGSYKFAKKSLVYIVFDGGQRWYTQEELGKLVIIYAGSCSTADEQIIKLAKNHQNSCVLVSNDRELINQVSRFGSKIVSVDKFYFTLREIDSRKLSKPKKTVVLKLCEEQNLEVDNLLYAVNNVQHQKDAVIEYTDLINELIKP